MDIGRIIYFFFVVSYAILGLMPLIRHNYWVFRAMEFPRVQKLVIAIFLVITGIATWQNEWFYYAALIFVSLHIIFLLYQIIPYTPLAKKTVLSSVNKSESGFKLMIANVYQYNRKFPKLVKLVQKIQPDVLFALETDEGWQEGLREIEKDYPYQISYPMDDTYGLLFYSKLPIENEEVRHIVKEKVPSIKLDLIYEDQPIRLYGLHPEPPAPSENIYTTARDSELLKVAYEAREHKGPVITFGDMNDVAWSYTTKQFIEVSGLKDPRKGRGIYATFDAQNWLLRWPLDHIFVSHHFRVMKLRKLRSIGSDHFPILAELELL